MNLINLFKAANHAKRFARGAGKGKYVQGFANDLTKQFKRNLKSMEGESVWGRVLPDIALGGGLSAAFTQGDWQDRGMAALGGSLGGIAGGYGARGLTGVTGPTGIMMAEMGGGVAGDMVGQVVADQAIRARHGGTTPWEQDQVLYEQHLKNAAIDEFLQSNGLA